MPAEMSARPLSLKQKNQRPADTLTAREKMIVSRLVLGHTNAEIADDLKISTQTVKNHLGSIFGKFGVWSRLELAARLLHHDRSFCPFCSSTLSHEAGNSRGVLRAPADTGPDWRTRKPGNRLMD